MSQELREQLNQGITEIGEFFPGLAAAIGIEGTALASSAIYIAQAIWIRHLLLSGPTGPTPQPGTTPLEVDLLPGALRLRVPSG